MCEGSERRLKPSLLVLILSLAQDPLILKPERPARSYICNILASGLLFRTCFNERSGVQERGGINGTMEGLVLVFLFEKKGGQRVRRDEYRGHGL